MRPIIFSILLFFLCKDIRSQCPPGADAGYVFYIHIVDLGPNGPIIDTIININVIKFQPFSKVYFYNTNNTIIDSVVTDANGSGWGTVRPTLLDSILLDSTIFTPGSYGIATNGLCSVVTRAIALLPVKLLSFNIFNNNNIVTLTWQTESEEPGTKYIVQESNDGIIFTDIYGQNAVQSYRGRYSYTNPVAIKQKKYYQLRMIDNTGLVTYSGIKVTSALSKDDVQIYTSSLKVSITVPGRFLQGEYSIFNSSGSLLEKKRISTTIISISSLLKSGIYFIRMTDINGAGITRSFITAE